MKRQARAVILGMMWAAGCGETPPTSPPPTTTPPVTRVNFFAAALGGRVVRSSRLRNPARVIDGSEHEETGTSFGENGRVGDTVSVDVETGVTVSATALRLRAAQDGGAFLYRRAMNGFRLDADTDGDGAYETTVIERSIPTDYTAVVGNVALPGTGELDLALTFPVVRARRWRFTGTQGFDTSTGHDGPRIREVELYAVP